MVNRNPFNESYKIEHEHVEECISYIINAKILLVSPVDFKYINLKRVVYQSFVVVGSRHPSLLKLYLYKLIGRGEFYLLINTKRVILQVNFE